MSKLDGRAENPHTTGWYRGDKATTEAKAEGSTNQLPESIAAQITCPECGLPNYPHSLRFKVCFNKFHSKNPIVHNEIMGRRETAGLEQKQADAASSGAGCSTPSLRNERPITEPPQPSVQPMEIKLTPVEKMVSHGDRIHFAHEKCGECVEPSAQGEQNFRKELEREWMAQEKWLDFTNWLIEVKLKAAPSITSERIAEILQEHAQNPRVFAMVSMALREAGVRVK